MPQKILTFIAGLIFMAAAVMAAINEHPGQAWVNFAIAVCWFFGFALFCYPKKKSATEVPLKGPLDPFSYYLYTTKADEVAEIESLVAEGKSHGEAINEMVRRHPTTGV